MTVSAATRLIPRPPARVHSRNTNRSESGRRTCQLSHKSDNKPVELHSVQVADPVSGSTAQAAPTVVVGGGFHKVPHTSLYLLEGKGGGRSVSNSPGLQKRSMASCRMLPLILPSSLSYRYFLVMR